MSVYLLFLITSLIFTKIIKMMLISKLNLFQENNSTIRKFSQAKTAFLLNLIKINQETFLKLNFFQISRLIITIMIVNHIKILFQKALIIKLLIIIQIMIILFKMINLMNLRQKLLIFKIKRLKLKLMKIFKIRKMI